jgi:hypothetical protein
MNTADRQLMQQVLRELEGIPFYRKYGVRISNAITALQKRLAHCDRCGKRLGGEGDIHTCTPDPIGDAQDRLIAELAAQPEQEPVCDKDPQGCWNVRCQLGDKCKNTPPAAQPESVQPVSMYEDWYDSNSCSHCGMVGGHVKTCRHYTTPPAAAPVQQEPVAEVVWGAKTDFEWKFKMLVELACVEDVPVKLYAGPFKGAAMYWHDTETDKGTTPPAAAQPEQEPYGWVQPNPSFNSGIFNQGAECPSGWVGSAIAVHTAPPAAQRKPLTDGEIQAIHDTYYRRMGPQEFARAIEAAHGIKE